MGPYSSLSVSIRDRLLLKALLAWIVVELVLCVAIRFAHGALC